MRVSSLLDLPGSGTGPLRARSPQARLCVGAFLLLAIAVTPLSLPWGALTLLAVAAASIVAAGTPLRLLARMALVFCVFYLPFLALLVLLQLLTSDTLQLSLAGYPAPVGEVAVRSFAVMAVTAAVVSTLTITDAIRGSAALPVPQLAVTLLFHILHQASLMMRETSSIAQAITLRGEAHGFAAGLVMVRSLPSVWLPRIEARIQRAGQAAEMRGAEQSPLASQPSPWRPGDAWSILLACAMPVLAVSLRIFQ